MTEPEHAKVDPEQTTPQWLIVGAVLIFVLAAVGAVALGTRSTGEHIKEGTWSVGTDVKPGTYRTEESVVACTWQLDDTGNPGDRPIMAPAGLTVTIAPDSRLFTTIGCGTWKRVGD